MGLLGFEVEVELLGYACPVCTGLLSDSGAFAQPAITQAYKGMHNLAADNHSIP